MIYLENKPRWTIIVVALIFMACAAITSARLIHNNDEKINTLTRKVSQHNELIQSLSKNAALAESRLQMVALYDSLARRNNDKTLKEFARQYAKQTQPYIKRGNEDISLTVMLDELKDIRHETAERIDATFIEKIAWQEKIAALKQKNIFYMNLALFAQLLSVAIVTIVRDLKK